jgi:MFS family permease
MTSTPAPGGKPGELTAEEADRATTNAAATLALTLPGDTVLYLLLPLYAATYALSLPEVGFLLAANRLVRIAGYGWVARFYAERGPRWACTLAAVGAAMATLILATMSGVWLLLVARLLWGLAFAAMNIANHALPTSEMAGAARRSGWARSIVAAGPTVGLLVGAVLAEFHGPRIVFFALTAVAIVAPLFAKRLPSTPDGYQRVGPRFGWPGALSVWAFAMGFTLDGLFVFGLSLLAAQSMPQGAVIAAGLALALRYVAEIVLSPVSGSLAARFGAARLLIQISIASAVALVLLAGDGVMLWLGVLVTVVLRALLQPLPAPVVAEAYPGAARVAALARQATWRDIGAGAGPLVAGLLFPVAPVIVIYGGAAALLAAASLWLAVQRR